MVNGQPLYTVKVRAMAPDADARARTADKEMEFIEQMTEYNRDPARRLLVEGTSMADKSQETQSFIREQI